MGNEYTKSAAVLHASKTQKIKFKGTFYNNIKIYQTPGNNLTKNVQDFYAKKKNNTHTPQNKL